MKSKNKDRAMVADKSDTLMGQLWELSFTYSYPRSERDWDEDKTTITQKNNH